MTVPRRPPSPQAALSLRTIVLTIVTMVFFAANSLLARLAMRANEIDAATFTAVRLLSGAAALAALVGLGGGLGALRRGSWRAALALFGYAFAFSFAYLSLDAGMGALILFATVQITMIGAGIAAGLRPGPLEWLGLTLALAGLVYLVSPGLTAPPLTAAALMAVAGGGWGLYSLAARGETSPAAATAGNFVRVAPLAALATACFWLISPHHASPRGLELAITSGAITSGLGYVMWYAALRGLTPTRAAIVQLTVPIIAALAGVLLLGEQMSGRLALAAVAILGGVGLALQGGRPERQA